VIEQLINRIKDAYFDLDRDTARRDRFLGQMQQFLPGAIQPDPSQVQQVQQQMQAAQQMQQMQQFPPSMQPAAPQPAPEPSLLDRLGASR
jgi:hypothetical protein